MSVQLHHEHDNVFRVEISGTLRVRDLQACEEQVLSVMHEQGLVRLLFVLREFDGWDVQDNWRDLEFYVRHGDAIERIAIVGDQRWRDLALMFAAADMRKAPVEYFDKTAVTEARLWLGS